MKVPAAQRFGSGVGESRNCLGELLSLSNSEDVDESAPFSASDVSALLEKIRVRSEEIKEKVHRTLKTHDGSFLKIIEQSRRAVADVEDISRALQALWNVLGDSDGTNRVTDSISLALNPRVLSDTDREIAGDDDTSERLNEADSECQIPVDIEVCQLAAESKRLRSLAKEREEAFAVVRTISLIYEKILATEKKFLPSQLEEAAKTMRILQDVLGLQAPSFEKQRDGEGDDVRAFKLLQDAWSDRYCKLNSILEELITDVVVFNNESSELSLTSWVAGKLRKVNEGSSEAVHISSIFSAMDIIGDLDVRLARLADAVFKHIMNPILSDSRTTVSLKLPAAGTTKTILCYKLREDTKGTEVVSAVDVYPKIMKVVQFIQNYVFSNDKAWMGRFGRVLWPMLAEAIISGCLSKAVPSETSELFEFQNISNLTLNFERDLEREGLIQKFDHSKGDKLSMYASDVEVHFSLKKKQRALAKARDLLVQSDFMYMANSQESAIKGTSDCIKEQGNRVALWAEHGPISAPAKLLLQLVHEILEDTCVSTGRTALELYQAARDVIMLYRAIVPVKLGVQLSTVTQVSALYHNDCIYIAQELATCTFQYQHALPTNVKELFTFADLVPLFQQMAEDVLKDQINLIELDLMEALDHGSGFRYTDDPRYFSAANQALQEMFTVLNNVSTLWRPLLADNVYSGVMGPLIDLGVGRLIYSVLAIDDLAVQETVQLRKLLLSAFEEIQILINSPYSSEDHQSTEEGSTFEVDIAKVVPSWRKLERLIDLLDMSLMSITQAWVSGDLLSCGFSSTEVQKLVKAIFSATNFREECLNRIGSTKPKVHHQ